MSVFQFPAAGAGSMAEEVEKAILSGYRHLSDAERGALAKRMRSAIEGYPLEMRPEAPPAALWVRLDDTARALLAEFLDRSFKQVAREFVLAAADDRMQLELALLELRRALGEPAANDNAPDLKK